MQISLGRRGDYAVRAALDLARHWERQRRKGREIADEMDIPPSFLPQVLADLARAGLVSSLAGPRGGYALTRSPKRISLLDVIEAAGGPVQTGECVLRGGPCRWTDSCAVHEPWSAAQDALIGQLAEATLAEVAERDEALEARSRTRP